MKPVLNIEYFGTIEDLNTREDLILSQSEEDTQFIKEYLGNSKDLNDFDGFLVKELNGEYTEIYGFSGTIPYLYKTVYKITQKTESV
jgi:hypothetical protein